MLDPHSKKDIEKKSLEILRGSKSFDIFPTPVDKIVSYSELLVQKDIDVSRIHSDLFYKAGDALRRAAAKVRGLLDRREKIIYLDLSQSTERKNFVKLHEVGHEVLPWQSKIHDVLDDDDNSLRADVVEEFEAEANYFATVTLFQHDRFLDELNKLSLGIESPMYLAKFFGASIHATLRRYVECSDKRCALLILENFGKPGQHQSCTIRNLFQSDKFSKTFGDLILPPKFDTSFDFVRDYYLNRRFKKDGEIYLQTENGEEEFNYHYFNNTYNAFIFLFPKREKKSSRTKFIITSDKI